MSGRVHAEAKAASKSSFTPVQSKLLAGSSGKQLVSQPPLIQAKLTIGSPNDRYEQEADRVADAVMRMPEPSVQRQAEEEEDEEIQAKPLAGEITPRVQRQVEPEEEEEELIQTKALSEQITPLVQRQEEDEEEEEIQTKPLPSQTSEVVSDVETSINSIRGGGQPLPGSTRVFFEPRFGQDFSQVRVHTGAQEAESARAVNARAYTVGRDVVFGAGQYAPETTAGQRLLAHELTHVVQQHNSKKPYMARYIDAWAPGMRPPPAYNPTSPIEVTVIDGSDVVGWMAGFFRIGEVYMTNVTTMVKNVLKALDKHRILRLNILDHGNQNGIQIGNDWITTQSIARYRPVLTRLRGRFAANGFVHVQHCNAGQNLNLIRALAATFGVPVYAGTGAHNPIYRFNLGDYVKCDSKGKCKTTVGRP
jgi:hypothetical protein